MLELDGTPFPGYESHVLYIISLVSCEASSEVQRTLELKILCKQQQMKPVFTLGVDLLFDWEVGIL